MIRYIWILVLVVQSYGQVTVKLLDTALLVNEGQQFQIRIQKTGVITSVINTVVSVKSPLDTGNDFVGSSQVGSFYPGGPDIVAMTFTVTDDSFPEVEETFTFELSAISSGVTVGTPYIAAITISANDDAYGVFSFLDSSHTLVTEADIITPVKLRVGRDRGTNGQVTVTFVVNSTQTDAIPGVDITPKSGIVVFQAGEAQTYLYVQINDDNIPENNEEFIITLTGATQGARVLDTEMVLIIQANDAPIRFQQAEYRFDEGPGTRTIQIPVLRGLESDGQSRIGSVNGLATVDFVILTDTASDGLDFTGPSNRQLVFSPGSTQAFIQIQILDDSDPEVEESFQILLSNAVGDVISGTPVKTTIFINGNDNPNGVISFSPGSDGVSLPFIQLNEDGINSGTFTVLRTAGTFGTVTVQWEIQRNGTLSGGVSGDILSTQGSVVFQAGQSQAKINVTAIQDSVAEPPERFVIKLLPGSVNDGAKVDGVIHGLILIEDSDNYHGTVEFGDDTQQQIIVVSNPRHVQLTILRTGFNQGTVKVNLTVVYTGPGDTEDVIEKSEWQTIFTTGISSQIFKVPINGSAFLQVGGKFTATLTDAGLNYDPPLGAFNTPKLGSKTTVEIPVTIQQANGEIGFQNTYTVTVSEPETSPYSVNLKLSREGTSGQAVISWYLAGSGTHAASVTQEDTGPTSGTAVMEADKSEADFTILINPDDLPELNEELTVTLTYVSPSDTQRLKHGATQVKVIILENDNPGGTFQFSSDMQDSYQVEEGSSPIDIVVDRNGGSLVTRHVQYTVVPNGAAEFYGYTNVLKFEPGIMKMSAALLPIADGIPEKEERFTLTLNTYGNSTSDIGSRSQITIDILENDNPYGLIQFEDDPPVVYMDESTLSGTVTHSISVRRTQGTFGSVTVAWDIIPSNQQDLTPLSGSITFGESQGQGTIQITTVPDDIPESAENFTIQLSNPTGGAELGSRRTFTVIINQNDFPIYFQESVYYVAEGSLLTVTIHREGDASKQETVKYRTLDDTALVGDYNKLTNQDAVFAVGKTDVSFQVVINEDTLPEGNETFFIEIFQIMGDLVTTRGSNCSVVILANDNAYGIFKLSPPFSVRVEEGSHLELIILRDGGVYGEVEVSWEIIDVLTNKMPPDGSQFDKSNGTVLFTEGLHRQTFTIFPRSDLAPEKERVYTVRLHDIEVVVGRTDVELASLADTDLEVTLTIEESDDPYGRFAFAYNSTEVTIAEDYYSGEQSKTEAKLVVERRMGGFGNVQVVWEIFTYQVAVTMPSVYDLLLIAEPSSVVGKTPGKRRPFTGTDVMYFDGAVNSYLTISSDRQPPPDDLKNGYTISAWIQPFADLNSYIVAKTTDDGSRFFYTLKVTTGNSGAIFLFGYSVSGSSNNQQISVTTNTHIKDGGWHHILVTVDSSSISFYLDGGVLGTKLLNSQPMIDLSGRLHVGAIAPGNEWFIGYLQDVRIYTRKLTAIEMNEVYNLPSKADLSPVSGYLSYHEALREQTIVVTATQDLEEENNELFTVMLLTANNGGTLSKTDSMSRITIEKSDNANGVFSIRTCSPSQALTETTIVSCTVDRQRGDDGNVNVTWGVFQSLGAGEVEAGDDFIASRGMMVFNAGERLKTFTVTVKDDDIPEVDEIFHIRLLTVASTDGSQGPTNTSGASIDLSKSSSVFTILKNDHSNGVLQFSNRTRPPSPDEGILPVATEEPTIKVYEEAGTIALMVVRAQGTAGFVTVEWRTTDGTAKSSGISTPDFQAGVGKLEFNDGQMYHFININIMDNTDPEDDKTFYVQLLNPTGGATLDTASTVTVVIRASDGAFGKFQFSDSSLSVETNELGESGYTSVFLKVDRLQGIIGTSTVTWEVLGNQDNDIVDLNGIIVFNHGDKSQNLEVKVRADTVPELDETYQVKLTSVEPGELGAGDKLVSAVTIQANDDPYGEFVFPSQLRPLQVEENYKNISLTIERLKGTFGTVDIYYRTLGPAELHPQVPVTVNRAGVNDYRAAEGMVRFGPTETQKTIIVTVMDDSDPENDESFYVILINATLHTSSQTRTVSNSPRLGLLSQSLAQIMITSNDIANGALELSPTSVKILESAPNVGVKLLRRGGTFGQVSVKFRVVNGTAIEHSDFETISDTAIIPDGASSVDLPIRIIDDNLPELEEIFYVELLNQITGGGVLGAEQYRVAVIHILASDDPEGAFEFETDGLSVEEPENGQSLTTNITIVRTGGSLGVVTITWAALLNGGSAASDISPVSGSVYFVSNELRRSISIQILPDNTPEGQEDIIFTLLTASNSGTIGLRKEFTLSILPNDNPYGTVQFSQNMFTLQEVQGDSIQLVSLNRLGGLFGQLRVSFSTKQTDIVTEATKDGSSVLSYYNPPLGGSRGLTGIVVDISSETNTPDACGKVCFRELACVAFEVSASLKKCAWYSTSLSTPLSNTADYQYYIGLTSKVNNLYSRRATEGIDYTIISNGFAFIPEGMNTGNVAVTIKGDNLPEIDEKFLIQLNSVEVVSGVTSTKHPPTLGSITTATVVIEQNDNAYGEFNLISDYPTAIKGGHQIAVEERHKFAVDLVVERKGGNLDDVSIDWYIDIGGSTATYGVDYTGDGATLQFTSGVASKLITVTILDDTAPEHNKTVIVKLRNPQGGAELSQDAMVTIVILENDNIAGVIGFGTTALVGKEGSDITLGITRARSSFGTVMVEWRIHGLNGVDPVTGFSHINGTLVFLPGDTSKDVILSILDDNTPEVNEEYQVLLSNIRTIGIGGTGAAIIDPQLKMATITINSSNYPHGLLTFSQTSLEIVKEEQDVMINLQIERKFGNIGNIRVSYEIKEGSVTPLSEDLLKATAGDDFEALQGYVDIGNGISYATIRVRVKEDSIPELDEVFIVVLTGVVLLNNSQVSNMPPQLGTKDTTSEIIISANDGTKGIIIFGSDSHSVAVDEITKNITLTIIRDQGTFGEVTVFCYAQGITDGTTQGQDFRFDPKEVTFKKGENRKYIMIEINNDDIPEPDEMFEVILANPRNGAILGTPSRANVTILANDDASGSFSFETDTAVTVEETSGDVKGVAMLKIVRGPGIYGVVNVPYQVIPEQVSNVNDLSPMQSIIVFQDKQDSAILELEAVDDSEPEQIERFTVRLSQPSNGGLLGQHTDKVVIVNPNDSPNGLMQIYARGTTNKTITVDENVGLIFFDIQRSQGTDGRISVDMATQPGTAITDTDISLVTLTPLQYIPSIQVVNWYSYTYNGLVYIVMLTNFRVGELTSAIGSDGSAGTINVDRLYHSTLFKWQGEMIPLQTIETDIASAAVSFSIGGSTYLAISNTGNVRRYQSKSRIYKVNTDGTLLVIQDLPTSGARDVKSFTSGTDNFLVFANSKDNNGNTLVPIDIYRWDQSIGMFTFAAWQSLDNQGAEAVAVFEMEGVVYMAVANNYNSVQTTYIVDSVIYKLNADNKFSEHQRIRTEGAVDVTHLLIQSLNILVFANNRGDSVNSPQKSWVYRWDSTTQMFFKHSDLDTYRVETTSTFIGSDDTAYLVVSNSIGNSEIFSWDIHDKKFKSVWTGPPANTMFPILIPQTTGALAVMTVGGIGSTENTTVYQFVKIKDSDFSPRTITMTFELGQKTLHSSVAIIQDDQPEETETFYVTLSNPTGGAEIGPHNMITVNILSNDNANGIIEFPQESLEKLVIEEDDKDNTVEVKVVRKHGFFGRVVVRWSITGDQNGLSDLTPLEGTIEFPNGYSVANIRITILNDNLAELPEISYIRLTEIIESGSTDPTSGAVIGKNNVAKIIVQANDSPYGVVLWERESVTLPEPDGTDLTQEVHITRQQGMMGQLQVSFQTGIATGYSVDRRAVSGEDYVASINTVIMQENVTRVPVQLVIKQDDIPEADESFIVNITGVAVMGMTPPAGAEPSVKVPGNIITITITENDNARGSVEFDVTTNIEGRIDTYEEYGKNSTISLKVKRTIGLLGTVTVSWEAETKEASFSDFQPPSGSVTLMDGEESGQITITILDDTIAEEMETFDIKLLTVTGGSTLGPKTRVRIAILKNDSPNGLFRFVQNQVSVKESTSVNDPNGEVTLDIERIQGMEGVVNVQWRLNAEAVNDFIEPIAGTVVFAQGDVIESITLKTKMDNILEGEERFRVSLISADNNADISHIRGDASVVLLPDLGSAGTVRILPDYNTVYIGEPGESSSTYNGQVEIVLTRGAGIYGNIAVTWVITPRDLEAFMQVEGTVQFVDLQQTAKITLQTKDDTVAEIRRIYTLQINSATGGATISSQPGTFKSDIIYVASDYPHGLFEFTLPEITSVTEDTTKVSIPILRLYGRINRVMVTYTTTPGTAEVNKDFYGTSGTLTFEHEQKQRNVEITIQQDDLPEGPEMFYLNLTSARLSIPSNNNYTIINGLQLDMAPAIGSLNVKTILIEKNDNAEGTVEFKEDTFTVLEESGVAKIPVVRKGGNYGGLTVRFTVTDINATAGVDYVIADTEVMIQDGESEAMIDIVLQDDSIMEYAEQFIINIDSIIGGAKLGAISTTTVTIAKSDYPNGMFGFKGPLKTVMVNPARQVQTTLTIERSGGIKGQQTVTWRLMGPNNPQRVLLETNDIFYISNNKESTSGNLVWSDGESGAKTITLNIKPYSSWEIQEIFNIEIVTITGYPKSSGDGEIGPNTGRASVTIEKNGDPSGVIQFSGVALAERTVDEPTGINPFQLQFPIKREESTGVVGTIQVFWEITGPFDSTTDFQPKNGSVYLGNLQRDASFNIQILPDTLPELTETFKVILTSVEGGAVIDTSNNEAVFHIRYNDHPHGLFGLIQSQQVINVDPSDLVRSVLLNFTRHEGTFGEVMLTFNLKYDIPQSGIVLSKTTGTVKFSEGQTSVRVTIAIEGNGFLAVGTTFTATLKAVDYLEAGVTEPPALKPLETEAKITVPSEAANSVIGFRDLLAGINEDTNTATMTLHRTGTYGPVSIPWQIGYRSGQEPGNGVLGSITPQTGTVTIPHGVDTKDFSVTVTALPGRVEYFVIHLPHTPSTTVSGGTKLDPTKTTVQIEPYGVVRFADNSTNPLVSELTEKAYLLVQRVYGSQGKIEVTYRSQGVSADRGLDYITTETNAIIMEPGEISALIMIQVLQDNHPEEEESFHINLTYVEKYPTELVPKISPRLSILHATSLVRIEESNDPYGILSIEPLTISVEEKYTQIPLTIHRTGGVFGTISVVVRSVGGGEAWTSQIVAQSSDINNTITQALGNRNINNIATGGQDYEVLDTKVTFQQGEVSKSVSVTILADNTAEPDETMIIYLTQPTGGARIALGSPDGGKKGFAIITILQNDLSNGIIGFSESSKSVTVNEDTTPTFSLQLSRINAYFGEVEVSWKAKASLTSTETEDAVLGNQLMKTAGTAVCPAQESSCTFEVSLKDDQEPEEELKFIIQLTSAGKDAELDYKSITANITVLSSDYVRGLLQFTEDSRFKVIHKNEATVTLNVERVKGRNYDVDVGFQTEQVTSQITIQEIDVYPALENYAFNLKTGVLSFLKNTQEIKHLDVKLTPQKASEGNPYPKLFKVLLKNPNNGASVHPDTSFSKASILIVEESNIEIWKSVINQGSVKNNTDILKTLVKLDLIVKDDLDNTELTLVEKILENILDEGQIRELPEEILNGLLNILCGMLKPSRRDATKGRSSLGLLMEKLAYCKLTGKPCSTPEYPTMSTLQYCLYAKISAARWPMQKIQNYKYQAQRDDSFTIPDEIDDPPANQVDTCVDFHMIEYSSELWFMTNDQPQLLSNKIINFGIKGRPSAYTNRPAVYQIHTPDSRIATNQAECVFYDYGSKDWVNPSGWCQVTNDLSTGQDDYVDCSCKHLTHYAVKATALDAGIVGYSSWFFVACFFCMVSMALAILVHHICSMLHAMFSANLLMHMCFACFATQLCYIVSAYGSPTEILIYNKIESNYRCIVMGLFLHYFFLTQFTWILAQAINYWKILVMNDEHTDRKYVFFFLIGWGSPAVILAIFYTVTYNLYKYVYDLPVDHIYGDVNNNGQICFIVNAYAGLGGIIVPVLLMLIMVGIIFMKAFQVTPQWQAYDDIYRGRYNINEIRTLMSFWGVITLTWFWGGLHLAYGQLWMLILFCIFNIIQGVMALVLYTILRNPWIQKCFGPQKSAYPVTSGGDGLPIPSHHANNILDIGSLKGSRASVLNESWEKDSINTKSTMKVKRTLPFNRNIYVTPPVLIPSITDDNQDEDLDELLFALKNDNFIPSETSSIASGKTSDISSKVDKYELRRISIADTHL